MRLSTGRAQRVLRKPTDVIVIGAGLAGLAAARSLHRRGVAVRVLEARGRVGGRTWTRRLDDGQVVDLGGQWIGPGQHRIAALLRELGVETFPQPTDGRKMLILRGRTRSYRRLIPPLSPWASWPVGSAPTPAIRAPSPIASGRRSGGAAAAMRPFHHPAC